MLNKYSVLFLLGTLSSFATANVIPHNTVVGFPNKITGYYAAFQPQLKVFDGCVPFPAVDASGNVSGGLKPGGAMNGHCSSSLGQVYVNMGIYKGECAVMYSWFFPKDQNMDGPLSKGHRYDWENIVVWLSRCSPDARINAVSYSSHGKYEISTTPALEGTHPLVAYQRNPFPLDHSLTKTYYHGGYQNGVSWGGLTPAARQTLETFNFGSALAPFNTYQLFRNFALAYYK